MRTKPQKIIIDTDIGYDADDVFALVLALKSKEIKILGITTVFEFTGFKQKVAEKILELAKMKIPVRAGIDFLNKKYFPANYTTDESERHGEKNAKQNGRGILPNSLSRYCKPRGEFAPLFLKQLIDRNPNDICLLCIGPLSNIAYLINHFPETARKIKKIVLMGGMCDLQQEVQKKEYNIRADPMAAQRVFKFGIPIIMVGLNVTK